MKSRLLTEIETGLRQDAFELHYQPIVPLAAERNIALEALMRWRHPELGLLTPAAFQEGFADQRVCADFGLYMLDKVFHDLALFRRQGLALGRVAINVTNSDFRSETFLKRFFRLSAETGIPLTAFCVEVTESMLLDLNQECVKEGLSKLHDSGVEIAFDDFGIGFASLTHLRQLPIDLLKIDRSFVVNIVSSKKDQAIVRGVIDIAHNLGASVTAEGVETVEQIRLLSALGCDMLQGWYFGKACEADRLIDLLSTMPACRTRQAGSKLATHIEASEPIYPEA
jgi:EAL domain-containing protein (putative c-di-GMP-specific phosphodiesterase class I)